MCVVSEARHSVSQSDRLMGSLSQKEIESFILHHLFYCSDLSETTFFPSQQEAATTTHNLILAKVNVLFSQVMVSHMSLNMTLNTDFS